MVSHDLCVLFVFGVLVMCWLLCVVCEELFVECCVFIVFMLRCSLCVVLPCVVWFVFCWLLIVARIVLFVQCCLLFVGVCVVCWLSFDGSWLLLVVRRALLDDRRLGVHCHFFVVGC